MFDSGAGSEGKAQDPAGVDSGSVAHLWCRRPFFHIKNRDIVFDFSITANSASTLAVTFFRLLEPCSYVRFDILKLLQVSLM